MFSILAVVLLAISLFAPIVPLGGYGVHHNLPQQVFVHTTCYHTFCPIVSIEGQSMVSISYALFGVGEYLFVGYAIILAFIW